MTDVRKFAKGAHSAAPENVQYPFEFMVSALENVANGYKQWMDVSKKMAEAAGHHSSANSAVSKRTAKAH